MRENVEGLWGRTRGGKTEGAGERGKRVMGGGRVTGGKKGKVNSGGRVMGG